MDTATFLQQVWTTLADKFVPESRRGYPYSMRSMVATLPALSNNIQVPTNDFTNGTDLEFVITHFRFEAGAITAAGGLYAAGGTAGSYKAINDFNVRVNIRDVQHNCNLNSQSTEIGLLIEDTSREYKLPRPLIIGPTGTLDIKLDNAAAAAIANVYIAAHGYMREIRR
jgi:hypothetical protein